MWEQLQSIFLKVYATMTTKGKLQPRSRGGWSRLKPVSNHRLASCWKLPEARVPNLLLSYSLRVLRAEARNCRTYSEDRGDNSSPASLRLTARNRTRGIQRSRRASTRGREAAIPQAFLSLRESSIVARVLAFIEATLDAKGRQSRSAAGCRIRLCDG
jgi:hypothetical protein